MIRILVLAFLIIFLSTERSHNLNRTIYHGVICYTVVLVYYKKSSDLSKGGFFGLVDVLLTTLFFGLVELFGFDWISSLELLEDPFSLPVLNMCERLLN